MSEAAEDEVRQLVDSAKAGDAEALDELVRRHLPALRAFCRLKSSQAVRDKEACSDLVQTACRQALQNLDKYDWQGPGSFRNWLFAFAMQKIRNRQQFYGAEKRSGQREVKGEFRDLGQAYATMSTPSRVAMGREEIERLEGIMGDMPDDYREIIVQSRIVGLSHAEIAEQMGRSEGAVRVLLSRALARLGTMLERE